MASAETGDIECPDLSADYLPDFTGLRKCPTCTCSICQDMILHQCILLECKHPFHKDCIKQLSSRKYVKRDDVETLFSSLKKETGQEINLSSVFPHLPDFARTFTSVQELRTLIESYPEPTQLYIYKKVKEIPSIFRLQVFKPERARYFNSQIRIKELEEEFARFEMEDEIDRSRRENIFFILEHMDLNSLLSLCREQPEKCKQKLPDGSNALHFLMDRIKARELDAKNPILKNVISYLITGVKIDPHEKRSSDGKSAMDLYADIQVRESSSGVSTKSSGSIFSTIFDSYFF